MALSLASVTGNLSWTQTKTNTGFQDSIQGPLQGLLLRMLCMRSREPLLLLELKPMTCKA